MNAIYLEGVLFLDSKALNINGKVFFFSIAFVNEVDERIPQGMEGNGNGKYQ